MAVVEHAKLTPDHDADQHHVPTGGLKAHYLWSSLAQLHQALFLSRCQRLWTTTTVPRVQAVQAVQQERLLPGIETGRAQPPALAEHRYGGRLGEQSEQHTDTPHQTKIVPSVGVLEPGVQGFDRRITCLYPDAHGCILLLGCLVRVL